MPAVPHLNFLLNRLRVGARFVQERVVRRHGGGKCIPEARPVTVTGSGPQSCRVHHGPPRRHGVGRIFSRPYTVPYVPHRPPPSTRVRMCIRTKALGWANVKDMSSILDRHRNDDRGRVHSRTFRLQRSGMHPLCAATAHVPTRVDGCLDDIGDEGDEPAVGRADLICSVSQIGGGRLAA